MPLYEYECKSCDATVEIFQHSSSQKPDCPECGSNKLEKLLSVIATPVVQGGNRSPGQEQETCGRPACASGCMFRGN